MSFFKSVKESPPDPIFGLDVTFKKDKRPNKVNIGVGIYYDAEGQPQVLSCVRKSESIIIKKGLDKKYSPIQGSLQFIDISIKLVFGEEASVIKEEKITGAQTLGATGALRVGAEFLVNNRISDTVFLSNPTWPNHYPIFKNAGMKLEAYPYLNLSSHELDFSGICESIKMMPAKSTILFQGSCHNPTGEDPTLEQWKELSTLLKKHQIIPFFDLAYQGFGHGIDQDAQAVRLFAEEGHEMLVASSYSKNLGLYGERVGLLSLICKDKETAERCGGQIQQVIRGNYSMPPLHGQRIVRTILLDEELRKEWERELAVMRERLKKMWQDFRSKLIAKGGKMNRNLPEKLKGMFFFSMLTPDQVHCLQKEHGIYLPNNGRINIAGLNDHNLDYVIDCITSVL